MENYLIDKNQYIYLTTDGFQEIFQTKTNFKDFELEFKNYREEDFAFYPFYVNDNLNIKISFSYVDRVSYSLNNYNIKITFISRRNEKVYYEDNVNVEKTLKIKVFQQNNTIALYLNDNFLNIIKEPILTYSTMGIEGLSSLGFKIKPITLLIPSKELQWTYQQENSNSFIFLNEKSEYVLENIFNKVNTSTNLFKDTIDTKKNNDTTREEFLNSPNWNVAPIIEKYGIDKKYTFSFFVKSNKTGEFQVYMQSGSGSKYDLSPTRFLHFQIKKENTWEEFSFTTQFSEQDLTQVHALLALYTAYGTDMRLRAKMMKMEIGEKATPFDFNNDEKGIDRSSKLLKNIELDLNKTTVLSYDDLNNAIDVNNYRIGDKLNLLPNSKINEINGYEKYQKTENILLDNNKIIINGNDYSYHEKDKTRNYWKTTGLVNGYINYNGVKIITDTTLLNETLSPINNNKRIVVQYFNNNNAEAFDPAGRINFYDKDKKFISQTDKLLLTNLKYSVFYITIPENAIYFNSHFPKTTIPYKIKVELNNTPTPWKEAVEDMNIDKDSYVLGIKTPRIPYSTELNTTYYLSFNIESNYSNIFNLNYLFMEYENGKTELLKSKSINLNNSNRLIVSFDLKQNAKNGRFIIGTDNRVNNEKILSFSISEIMFSTSNDNEWCSSLYDLKKDILNTKINKKYTLLETETKNNIIAIYNTNNNVNKITKLQLEYGSKPTTYIENKDTIQKLNESVFKVPTKNNIDRIAGTLVYEYVPNINQKEFTIFEIGDFKLIYKEDRYILYSVTSSMPNKQITLIQPLKERKTWIVWTWINNSHKLLHIQANEIKSSKNETGEMNGIFNTMNFAPDKYMSGIINNIDIYNLDSFYLQETTENFLKYQKENSQNKIFGLNLSSQIEFFKKPFLESSLVPLDGSPILIRNNEGEMQRQFFFDENTGKYRDYNEEYLTYLGNREIKVSYNELDEKFNPTIKVISGMNKGLEIGQPVSIKDNVIKMTIGNEESQALFGEEIVVTYKIKNSYNIEFNEKSANDSYIINLDNPNGEDIIVTQEGNRFSNKKLAKEIELNPILNPRHEGFLYITKNSQTTNSFRIQVSSDMVSANGMDSADIMIEAIDEYGNEVLSPYLDIYIIDDSGIETNQYGSITPIINYETMKARNTSGRLYMRYNSPYLSIKEINREKKIYIVVYDRFNKIGTQTSLILKPSSIENKNTLLSISRNSNIPFEYFSRYFERNNIPQEVLKVLDYDNNGQLTREDLNQLMINQYNLTEMIGATESLKSLEEF